MVMGDLTRNLSRHEFGCKCGCNFDVVDYELVVVIQNAVFHFENLYGKKVIVSITGGNRCQKHNDNLRKLWNETKGKKGAKTAKSSTHIEGKAADHKFFIIDDGSKTQIDPSIVYSYYDSKYPDKYGLGKYGNRTHIDSRKAKARW